MAGEFPQLVLCAMSLEKQQAAAISMLEAALLTGSESDVRHLRNHAHNLLDQFMDSKAQTAGVIKGMLSQ